MKAVLEFNYPEDEQKLEHALKGAAYYEALTSIDGILNAPFTKADATSLFTMRCASCHGDDGKLGASGAKDLSISKLTDAEITSIIYNGKNGMPAFGDSFTKEQLDALVPIVKSLRK